MLSITVIVVLVAAVSGVVNVQIEERQFQKAIILGADQLTKGITSAIWEFMLEDHRDAAYQVMRTIALKQGVDHIRMFNRAGQVVFSTPGTDRNTFASVSSDTCALMPFQRTTPRPCRPFQPGSDLRPPGRAPPARRGHTHL